MVCNGATKRPSEIGLLGDHVLFMTNLNTNKLRRYSLISLHVLRTSPSSKFRTSLCEKLRVHNLLLFSELLAIYNLLLNLSMSYTVR